MKNIVIALLLLSTSVLLQSFSTINPSESKAEITKSNITWKGYKATGSHVGNLNLKSGFLKFDDKNQLTGGEFVVDMTSLVSTDLSGEYKTKLEGHLKSDDFFGVQNHATSTLKITKAKSSGKNSYIVTADLTIKGITKPIKFDASIYGKKAAASLKIDRTAYDIKYGSGSFFENLQDNLIYDEFDLVIDFEF